MRAFLTGGSLTAARLALQPERYGVNQGWLASASLREARRILGQVEPEGVGDYHRLTWLGDWSGEVAVLLDTFIRDAPGDPVCGRCGGPGPAGAAGLCAECWESVVSGWDPAFLRPRRTVGYTGDASLA